MAEIKREGFSLLRSYYEAAISFPDDKDKLAFTLAVQNYGLNQIEPNFKNGTILYSMWILIKPNLDMSYKRSLVGKLGGAPINNTNAKKEEQNNQKTTKKQPKNNQKTTEREIEIENEIENEIESEREIEIEKEPAPTREMSLSQKKFSQSFPNKMIDCDLSGQVFDMDLLIKKVNESSFLKADERSLKWLVDHYDKIVIDYYKDFKQENLEEKTGTERKYTKEQLSELFDNLETVKM